VNGSFNYSQNVETLLVTYMNSSFSYSGSARKRWKQVNFSASASASRTGLTEDPGSVSSSQSYNTSIGFGSLLSATAGYSKSSGQAIATGSGLVPIPIPPVVPNSDISLYGGDSYSISLSSTPLKNLGLSASYSNSNSNSSTNSVNSQNTSNQFNALAQYHVRKIFLLSGYSRLQQGFSATGTAPQVISSFYVGVSRWFNFF
jgi:predicted porin